MEYEEKFKNYSIYLCCRIPLLQIYDKRKKKNQIHISHDINILLAKNDNISFNVEIENLNSDDENEYNDTAKHDYFEKNKTKII